MSKVEMIKDNAYMVLSDLAFCFQVCNGSAFIIIYNIKNIKQTTTILVRRNGSFLLKESTMSEANKYKGLFLAERNKEELLRGLSEWGSIQRKG